MAEKPDAYIWINNWDRFQTYMLKRGKPWAPPWIKVYSSLFEKDEFLDLPIPTQLLLVKLFNAFSTTHGQLTNDTRRLSERLHQRVTNAQLKLLNHAGFIDFCSRTVLEQRWNMFLNGSTLEVDTDIEGEEDQEQDQEPNPTPPIATELPPELRPQPKNGSGGEHEKGLEPIAQTAAELIAQLRGAA